MSSLHHDASIDANSKEAQKPKILRYYNSTKGGVDVNDQLCAMYNVARRTKRWPMVMFYLLMVFIC